MKRRVYRFADWQIGATKTYDADGRQRVEVVTCGNCGRSWNEALITSRTPAPAARCPFEEWHNYRPLRVRRKVAGLV